MSEHKRLAVPRELWRKAMPTAPERVIRALETLSDYYDTIPERDDDIDDEIALAGNIGITAQQQIAELKDAIQDLQAETAPLPVVQTEPDQTTIIINQVLPQDDVLPIADPSAQAAAMFLARSTPDEFTPTLVGLTTAGTGTYTYRMASGQLIGNRFYFSVSMAWTAHTGTGLMAVTGLPFASLSTANRISVVSIVADNLTYGGQLTAYILPSESQIRIMQQATGAALSGVAMDTAAAIHINGFYEV